MVEENIKLQKDDLLVVYTDGVTEAMNGRRELWGEKRFVEFIKANGRLTSREFIDKLRNELKEFTMGYPQNDDITIVAIKEKKTGADMLRSIDKQITMMKKKKMKIKDIEKELGIDLELFKKLKKQGSNMTEEMQFFTFEQKKELMRLVVTEPALNVSKYAEKLAQKYQVKISEELVVNELRRVNLVKAEQRILYAKERTK
jgi:hypothetical protein